MMRTRREFICESTHTPGGSGAAGRRAVAAGRTGACRELAIGCFNRPWTKWTFDETLEAIKAAGYEWTGLLTRPKGDPSSRGRDPRVPRRSSRSGRARPQGEHGRAAQPTQRPAREDRRTLQKNRKRPFLGLKYAMTFGIDQPAQYAHYFQSWPAPPPVAEKGVQMVMKPHGGGSGASDEIRARSRRSVIPISKSGTTPATSSTTPARTPSPSSSRSRNTSPASAPRTAPRRRARS